MSESDSDNGTDLRSLALTPTWSVATVLTVFVAVSLLVERSIHRLSNWLKKTDRKPLLAAVEKMKEELMLLGFISLLLTATSSIISNICIPSKFYDGNYEPFVSYEGLEQLHRFIFVMAVTHISYSCLTMLLAIVKIHSWREWEEEAHMDRHNSLSEITRALTMRRQSTFVRVHTSNPMHKNGFLVWVTCFFRQFGRSVVRADYLTLRQGFITCPTLGIRFVAFMLFNIKGSNLYFWIALIPVTLVLLVGAKLQHVIATLALESAGISGSFSGPKFRPRDELFWFNKPELLLSLIHFILFQNAFELASFFWFWVCGAIFMQLQHLASLCTCYSVEEDDDNHLIDSPRFGPQSDGQIELQPINTVFSGQSPVANETSSRIGTPLLRPSASISSPVSVGILQETIPRSSSMPH
ncbi:hypothetical protein DH2020_033562 [Rehmannia glutinosa]|uniref:MLO-like protein n=1 Tax=Rehmannia glutinosa TaxID=99300 RepID=A0ABR0VER9_REHGL